MIDDAPTRQVGRAHGSQTRNSDTLASATPASGGLVEGLHRDGHIRLGMRPVVLTRGARTVGYQVVTSGPAGSTLENPTALRHAASTVSEAFELDRVVAAKTRQLVSAAGQTYTSPVYVTVHMDSIDRIAELELPETVTPVLGITARDLPYRVQDAAWAAQRAHAMDIPVVVTDVDGLDTISLIGVLRPDAVALDGALFDGDDLPGRARLSAALRIMLGSTGSLLLASDLADDAARCRAAVCGVVAATGAGMAAAEELDGVSALTVGPLARAPRGGGLFDHASYGVVPNRGTKRELIALSKTVEQILADDGNALLMGLFQKEAHFTPTAAIRWAGHAENCSTSLVAAVDMPDSPAMGVRGHRLDPQDPLAGEWHVGGLSERTALILVAKDLGDTGPDLDRRFDWVVCYDREIVATACRSVLARLHRS